MSTSRSIPDPNPRNMAEYKAQIDNIINGIGTKREPKLPISNNDADTKAQEAAIAKLIYDSAEKRHETARTALREVVSVPSVAGKHIVHDTTFALVEVQQVTMPKRLNEGALLNELVKSGHYNMDQAAALLAKCKMGGDGFQSRYTTLLKR